MITLTFISEIMLDKENEEVLQYVSSSKNTFCFWDVKAPTGYVVSVFFQEFKITGGTTWDGYMFLSLGDDETKFNNSTDPCKPWKQITKKGKFQPEYKLSFTSRSSSVKIIFSSFTTSATFSVTLHAEISEGK